MKKLVASIATGVMIAGATITTASAAEHEVEKGDNLWGIAKEYDTTVDELVEINDLNTTTIQPKQTLFINDIYKVQKGDTLTGISNDYDVSIEDLKEWNNLKSDILSIGQELEIQGVNVDQDETETTSSEETSNQSDDSEQSAEPAQTTADNNENTNQESSQDNSEGKTVTVTATAYTADCAGCSGVTSTGIDLNANPDKKVIAVDPNVIPLGSEVYVEGYGRAIAADVGGAINGDKIDVHVPSEDEAHEWGVRTVDVTIVE
ncbi:3D domain-containing protein [Lentibacillus salicampi]|uniref:LysM peptidoglycan-binding domain-containing protein n=1 Tax=Lentibacillus salicampi TaxID=175306 RepID=A0A4Y9AER4_9BACI|nr:3D domain-containing protein [Lentibacillus salicampi]TFJ93450.1 LysM peptidoglycan-binding domain-containing protein [Lentibacillus salicampi]